MRKDKSFETEYPYLPTKLQGLIKHLAFFPTDSNRSYVMGYMQAAKDYGYIPGTYLSFWIKETAKMQTDTTYVERYFE